MVREIIKDPGILTQISKPFVFGEDDTLIQDMLDTANANKERCAGLAAIQLGVPLRAILVRQGDKFVPFVNPCIIKRSIQTYHTTEGCLSLVGEREVKRHRSVIVGYFDRNGKKHIKEFHGYTAQIIQHEVDHCNGVLI